MSMSVAFGTSSSWKASRPRGCRAAAIARIVPPWETTSAGSRPGADRVEAGEHALLVLGERLASTWNHNTYRGHERPHAA